MKDYKYIFTFVARGILRDIYMANAAISLAPYQNIATHYYGDKKKARFRSEALYLNYLQSIITTPYIVFVDEYTKFEKADWLEIVANFIQEKTQDWEIISMSTWDESLANLNSPDQCPPAPKLLGSNCFVMATKTNIDTKLISHHFIATDFGLQGKGVYLPIQATYNVKPDSQEVSVDRNYLKRKHCLAILPVASSNIQTKNPIEQPKLIKTESNSRDSKPQHPKPDSKNQSPIAFPCHPRNLLDQPKQQTQIKQIIHPLAPTRVAPKINRLPPPPINYPKPIHVENPVPQRPPFPASDLVQINNSIPNAPVYTIRLDRPHHNSSNNPNSNKQKISPPPPPIVVNHLDIVVAVCKTTKRQSPLEKALENYGNKIKVYQVQTSTETPREAIARIEADKPKGLIAFIDSNIVPKSKDWIEQLHKDYLKCPTPGLMGLFGADSFLHTTCNRNVNGIRIDSPYVVEILHQTAFVYDPEEIELGNLLEKDGWGTKWDGLGITMSLSLRKQNIPRYISNLPFYIVEEPVLSKIPLIKSQQKKKSIQKAIFSHYSQFYKNIKIQNGKIPLFIINRDRLDPLKKLVDFFKDDDKVDIVIIDNNSTYAPLLWWYQNCPYNVVRLPDNIGKYSPWDIGIVDAYKGEFYIVTDSDIVPSESCPRNITDFLIECHKDFPGVFKVGLSLEIDDLPENSYTEKVVKLERRFWKKPANAKLFYAPVDTTFAMYSKSKEEVPLWNGGTKYSLRTNRPYVANHIPWYFDPEKLPEDEIYYIRHSEKSSPLWTNGLKIMNQPIEQEDNLSGKLPAGIASIGFVLMQFAEEIMLVLGSPFLISL